MNVKTRRIPEQLVLTRSKKVKVGVIEDHIAESAELMETIAAPVAPMFVIYHGEVSESVANEVEVCLPIAAAPAGDLPEGVTLRTEPAHHEAYVTITKAEVDYPEIMAAYGTLDMWLSETSFECTDAPREVYFADWDSAAMDDLVCDVAFPYQDPDSPELDG